MPWSYPDPVLSVVRPGSRVGSVKGSFGVSKAVKIWHDQKVLLQHSLLLPNHRLYHLAVIGLQQCCNQGKGIVFMLWLLYASSGSHRWQMRKDYFRGVTLSYLCHHPSTKGKILQLTIPKSRIRLESYLTLLSRKRHRPNHGIRNVTKSNDIIDTNHLVTRTRLSSCLPNGHALCTCYQP